MRESSRPEERRDIDGTLMQWQSASLPWEKCRSTVSPRSTPRFRTSTRAMMVALAGLLTATAALVGAINHAGSPGTANVGSVGGSGGAGTASGSAVGGSGNGGSSRRGRSSPNSQDSEVPPTAANPASSGTANNVNGARTGQIPPWQVQAIALCRSTDSAVRQIRQPETEAEGRRAMIVYGQLQSSLDVSLRHLPSPDEIWPTLDVMTHAWDDEVFELSAALHARQTGDVDALGLATMQANADGTRGNALAVMVGLSACAEVGSNLILLP
jgi:hypothetical protein